MELSELELDLKKIDEGDWVRCPAIDSDLRVKGLRSQEFRRKNSRRIQKARQSTRSGEIDSLEESRIFCQTLYDCDMVTAWRPLTDHEGNEIGKGLTRNGEVLDFDKALLRSMLTERRYELFQDAVTIACRRVGEREEALQESDLGNSGEGSEPN